MSYSESASINFTAEDSASKVINKLSDNMVGLQGSIQLASLGFNALDKGIVAFTKSTTETIKGTLSGTWATGLGKLSDDLYLVGEAFNKAFAVTTAVKVLDKIRLGFEEVNKEVTGYERGLQSINATGIDTTLITTLNGIKGSFVSANAAINQVKTSIDLVGVAMGNTEEFEFLGQLGVSKLNEFSKALTTVGTVLKDDNGKLFTAEGLKDYGVELQKIVNKDLKNAVSSTEALAASYEAVSAGFTKTSDSQKVMTAGLKLAVSSGADAGEVMRLLSTTMNAYGLGANQAAETAAKLNAVVENGITTVQELTLGFGQVASVAKEAGVDMNGLGASLAVLTSRGTSTATAMTGLQSLFRTIIDPSTNDQLKKMNATLEGTLVKFDSASVKQKGLAQSLQDLNKAFGGNSAKLREIFQDSLAYRTALVLVDDNVSKLTETTRKFVDTTADGLENVFGIRLDNDKIVQYQQLVNKLGESLITLGRAVEPVFLKGAAAVGKSVDQIASFIEHNKELIASALEMGLKFKAGTTILGTFFKQAKSIFWVIQGYRLLTGALIKNLNIQTLLAVVHAKNLDIYSKIGTILGMVTGVTNVNTISVDANSKAVTFNTLAQNTGTGAAARKLSITKILKTLQEAWTVAVFRNTAALAGENVAITQTNVNTTVYTTATGSATVTTNALTASVGGLSTMFAGLMKTIGTVIGAFKSLFAFLLANPIVAVAAAAFALGAALLKTGKNANDLKKEFVEINTELDTTKRKLREELVDSLDASSAAALKASLAMLDYSAAIEKTDKALTGAQKTGDDLRKQYALVGAAFVATSMVTYEELNRILDTNLEFDREFKRGGGIIGFFHKIMDFAPGFALVYSGWNKVFQGVSNSFAKGTYDDLDRLTGAMGVMNEQIREQVDLVKEARFVNKDIIKLTNELQKIEDPEARRVILEEITRLKNEEVDIDKARVGTYKAEINANEQRIALIDEELAKEKSSKSLKFKNLTERKVALQGEIDVTKALVQEEENLAKSREEAQAQRERLSERMALYMGDENAVANALKNTYENNLTDLKKFGGEVAALLGGDTITSLEDMTKATDTLDQKVAGTLGSINDKFEQGLTSAETAYQETADLLETEFTDASGRVIKLKELLDPKDLMTIQQQQQNFFLQASKQRIALLAAESDQYKLMLEGRRISSFEAEEKILANRKASLEEQITANQKALDLLLEANNGEETEVVKQKKQELANLAEQLTNTTLEQQISAKNEGIRIQEEEYGQKLELLKTYQNSIFTSSRENVKQIKELELTQLKLSLEAAQNELNALVEGGGSSQAIATLENQIAILQTQVKTTSLDQQVSEKNEGIRIKEEEYGQKLNLLKAYQNSVFTTTSATSKKINELELQQLTLAAEALRNELDTLIEGGGNGEVIAKLENQLSILQTQVTQKSLENIEAANQTRFNKMKTAYEKEASLLETKQLQGLATEEEVASKKDFIRRDLNLREQERLRNQISTVKENGGDTLDLEKQLVDTQLAYQKDLTEGYLRELGKRKTALNLTLQAQELNIQKSLNALKFTGESLNEELKLREAQADLERIIREYRVEQYQLQLRITPELDKRATIERKIAEETFRNLEAEQVAEIEKVNLQKIQNDLALQEKNLTLDLAKLKNNLNIAQQQINIQEADRLGKSEQEKELLQLQLASLKEETVVLSQQELLLQRNQVAQEQLTENTLQQLEYKQRIARENGLLDLELARTREIVAQYERQAQIASHQVAIKEQEVAVLDQIQASLTRAVEKESRLTAIKTQLIKRQSDFQQQDFNYAVQSSNSEVRKYKLQKEALDLREESLKRQQALELEGLKNQEKLNALALQRKEFEIEIAKIKARAVLAEAQALQKATEADPLKTLEEKEAARLKTYAASLSLIGAEYESQVIEQEKALTRNEQLLQRQGVLDSQRQERDQIETDRAGLSNNPAKSIRLGQKRVKRARNNDYGNVSLVEIPDVISFEDFARQYKAPTFSSNQNTSATLSTTVNADTQRMDLKIDQLRQKADLSELANKQGGQGTGSFTIEAPINITIANKNMEEAGLEIGDIVYNTLYKVTQEVERRL